MIRYLSASALAVSVLAYGCSSAPKAPAAVEACESKGPSTPEEAKEGGLDRDHIACVINRDAIGPVRACYEATFATPEYKSEPVQVTSKFLIDKNGKVSKSEADSANGGEQLKACIANIMSRLQFAEPSGGQVVTVAYPFMFRRSSGSSLESIFDN